MQPDENVAFYGRHLENEFNPFDRYTFNSLPFCKNKTIIIESNIYPKQKLTKIPFNIRFMRNEEFQVACSLKISPKRFRTLNSFVLNNIWMNLMMRNITSYSKIGFYEFNTENEYIPYIFSHFHFDIAHANGEVMYYNLTSSHPKELIENSTINYTYSVKWKPMTEKLHDPFFKNIYRVISLIAVLLILLSAYLVHNKMKMQVHEFISCDHDNLFIISVSGTTMMLNFVLAFIYLTYISAQAFSRFDLLPFTLVASYISGNVLTARFTRNPLTSFISMLIPPFIFVIFDSLSGLGVSEYSSFYMLYFILHLGHFKKVTKKDFEKPKKQISLYHVIIGSLVISVVCFASILSESYYFEASFMKRKNFEYWSFQALSLGCLFTVSYLISFSISAFIPFSRDPDPLCLLVFIEMFMMMFGYLGILFGFISLSIIISIVISLITTSGTILGIHNIRGK